MNSVRTSAFGFRAWLLLAIAPLGVELSTPAALAQPALSFSQLFSIMMIDIAPDRAADGASLLAAHAKSLASVEGCLSVQLIRQPPPSANHFAIVTVWKSGADRNRYLSGAIARSFRDRLQPIAASPVDDRIYDRMTQ